MGQLVAVRSDRMGFFKGFKRDFAQAVNELMPEYDDGNEDETAEETENETEDGSAGLSEEEEPEQQPQPEEELPLPDFSEKMNTEEAAPAPQVNVDEAVTEAMLREETYTGDLYGEEEPEEEFGVIPTYEMEGQFSMFEGEEGTLQETASAAQEDISAMEYAEAAVTEEVPVETVVEMPVGVQAETETESATKPEEPAPVDAVPEEAAVPEKESSEEREDQELSELGTEIRKDETDFDLGDTTYITKNTTISGDVETEGSLDVIGTVNGNVTCLGKLILGGRINGNVITGDLYANQAHVRGEIEATGHVKIGTGTVCIGNIRADSAVIAGAVKGDLDVQGQVIVDSSAVILGNIKSKSVQVNSGAIVDGFCTQAYSDVNPEEIFADEAEGAKKEEAEVIEPISEEEMQETGKNGAGNGNRSNNNRNRKNGGQKKNV